MAKASYPIGSELGDLQVTWRDDGGNLIDFTSAYTFSLKVGTKGSAALITKTTGFTGAATAPNLTVAWSTTGELNSITSAGTYTLQITATRTADSKTRVLQADLTVLGIVT